MMNKVVGLSFLGVLLVAAVCLLVYNSVADEPRISADDQAVTKVYVAAPGDSISVLFNPDDSVEVRFIEVDGVYLKAFIAQREHSASGARYRSGDRRFTLWTKRDEAMILHGDEVIFQGLSRPPL